MRPIVFLPFLSNRLKMYILVLLFASFLDLTKFKSEWSVSIVYPLPCNLEILLFILYYIEIHQMLYYILSVRLCLRLNARCQDSFVTTWLIHWIPLDVPELDYCFRRCRYSNQTALFYCPHEQSTSIYLFESQVPFFHFAEHTPREKAQPVCQGGSLESLHCPRQHHQVRELQ